MLGWRAESNSENAPYSHIPGSSFIFSELDLGLGLKMFVPFLGCLLLNISWIDQITTFKLTDVTGNALSSLVIIGDPPERQGVVAGWLAGGPVGDRAG